MNRIKKCTRVKNPCKICLQQVSNKNGLQCKGACKRWAHFSCLNYTPGKIQDIKAGIITVTCPCPTCNVSENQKEYIKDTSYTCNNNKCPANIFLPRCEHSAGNKPIPEFGDNSCDADPAVRTQTPTRNMSRCCQQKVLPVEPPSCKPVEIIHHQKTAKCTSLPKANNDPPCSVPVMPCPQPVDSYKPVEPPCDKPAKVKPCVKPKKPDPCAKPDLCAKADPCAKQDPCPKPDPCAKSDPCAKPDPFTEPAKPPCDKPVEPPCAEPVKTPPCAKPVESPPCIEPVQSPPCIQPVKSPDAKSNESPCYQPEPPPCDTPIKSSCNVPEDAPCCQPDDIPCVLTESPCSIPPPCARNAEMPCGKHVCETYCDAAVRTTHTNIEIPCLECTTNMQHVCSACAKARIKDNKKNKKDKTYTDKNSKKSNETCKVDKNSSLEQTCLPGSIIKLTKEGKNKNDQNKGNYCCSGARSSDSNGCCSNLAKNSCSSGKAISCSCISPLDLPGLNLSSKKPESVKSSSDSALTKESQKVLLCTIHELCSTVGHLSEQVKELLSKMMAGMQKNC